MPPVPDVPGPAQESVWDYPRPPRLDPTTEEVVVEFAGTTIARSTRAIRVLETSHPPGIYLPPDDVRLELLTAEPGSTFCEWKGEAVYYSIEAGGRWSSRAVWAYPRPTSGYEAIAGYLSFYPGRVDRCLLGGEEVAAQPGGFYGGWITSRVTGPFKGGPGTAGW
jgi:uncharacterized protein (DUF427 family)